MTIIVTAGSFSFTNKLFQLLPNLLVPFISLLVLALLLVLFQTPLLGDLDLHIVAMLLGDLPTSVVGYLHALLMRHLPAFLMRFFPTLLIGNFPAVLMRFFPTFLVGSLLALSGGLVMAFLDIMALLYRN